MAKLRIIISSAKIASVVATVAAVTPVIASVDLDYSQQTAVSVAATAISTLM